MYGIGGLSGSTSNSIRGFGGLASGLDRDTLIENMTYSTKIKIEQQRQKKTTLEWKQSAIRNITDKMISFGDKYTSTMTSSTNLLSSAFWGRSVISAQGANGKYVSVSGMAQTGASPSIAAVKQLAQKASWSSSGRVSDGILNSGNIDTEAIETVENLQGQSLTIKYGSAEYTINMQGKDEKGNEYKFDTVENIVNSLNDIFKNTKISGEDGINKLSDVVKVEADGDKLTFKNVNAAAGNILEIAGGTALETLGLEEETAITAEGVQSKEMTRDVLLKDVSFTEKIAGKKLTVRYNGNLADIKIPSAEELDVNGLEGKALMDEIAKSMQDQLNTAFGKGRIEANVKEISNPDGSKNYSLSFETKIPGGGADTSSTFSIVNGESGLLGENGALKMNYGESNRVNLSAKLEDAGFAKGINWNGKDSVKVNISGKEVEIKKDDTVRDLMDRINEETDLTISYQEESDKFTVTSKQDGASGAIWFDKSSDGDDTGLRIVKSMFGGDKMPRENSAIRGQDAIVMVKYGDSNEEVEIRRGSNSFTLDGMTIGLKGEFGYKEENGVLVRDKTAEEVTFNAEVDTDKIVDTVKKMVEEYNEIVELVNSEVKTRPDRSYAPLTSEQRKELSEDEIKLYEEEAKKGLLFGDSDLRALSNDLRWSISPVDLPELEKIGISVSSSYSDNGKISFDESKFKAALKADPENVQNLFTKSGGTDADGNTISNAGIAVNMKNVIKKYANNIGDHGILVKKAGTAKAPRSITDNAIYKQLEEINKKISNLQARMKTETDRYIKQFTSLESLISQMNSQSSYLSQFGASY